MGIINSLIKRKVLWYLILALYPTFAVHAEVTGANSSKAAFIKAGGTGDGSSANKPYGSLAEAEADGSWKILFVLPSTTAIDGKLKLKPGQEIIGTGPNPVKSLLPVVNPEQACNEGSYATLTSTSHKAVIEATGDNKISNLYIKNAHATGIDLTFGTNVTVRNVLICGHNQSKSLIGELYPITQPENLGGQDYPMPGILGYPLNNLVFKPSGTFEILDSRVEQSFGNGISIFARNAFDASPDTLQTPMVKRKVIIDNTEVRNLRGITRGTFTSVILGIRTIPLGDNAEVDTIITNSTIDGIHDGSVVIGADLIDSTCTSITPCYSNINVTFNNNTIRNVSGYTVFGFPLLLEKSVITPSAKSTYIVQNNLIEDSSDGVFFQVWTRVPPTTEVSLDFSGNTLRNLNTQSYQAGLYILSLANSFMDVRIENNVFQDLPFFGIFFDATGYNGQPRGNVMLRKNVLDGFDVGIGIGSFFRGWKDLTIKAEENCLINGTIGLYDLDYFDGYYGELGTATLDAGGGTLGSKGRNSFVGMELDILFEEYASYPEVLSPSTITAANNYWSPGNPNYPGTPSIFPETVVVPFEPVLKNNPCGNYMHKP